MQIRAHHLVCIQGFRGLGYNQKFIDNMTKVIETIKSHPNLWIEVITNCDIICSACPHEIDGICRKEKASPEKVPNSDRQVLRGLRFKAHDKILAKDIPRLVEEKLGDAIALQNICQDCDWKEVCTWFVSHLPVLYTEHGTQLKKGESKCPKEMTLER